jgi:hypothetical protein
VTFKGIINNKTRTPWLPTELPDGSLCMQDDIFSISSYSKMSANGILSVTLFSNVPEHLASNLKFKWQDSISNIANGNAYDLRKQFTIFGVSIGKLQDKIVYYELNQILYIRGSLNPGSGEYQLNNSRVWDD